MIIFTLFLFLFQFQSEFTEIYSTPTNTLSLEPSERQSTKLSPITSRSPSFASSDHHTRIHSSQTPSSEASFSTLSQSPNWIPNQKTSNVPSKSPIVSPSAELTVKPSKAPYALPSRNPSSRPTNFPSSFDPSRTPTPTTLHKAPSPLSNINPSSRPTNFPSSFDPSPNLTSDPPVTPYKSSSSTPSSEPSMKTTDALPTTSPTSYCMDNPHFYYFQQYKTCEWIDEKNWKRKAFCEYESVTTSCQRTCGICCRDNDSFEFLAEKRNCEWIGKNKSRKNTFCSTNPNVIQNCPEMCDTCRLPNLSDFGFSLFSEITTENEEANVLLSPFSVASALALILAGATPQSACQTEIRSVLSVSSHAQLRTLSKQIIKSSSQSSSSITAQATLDEEDDDGGGVEFTSANGVWIDGSITESYVQMARDVHRAKASSLPETFDPINQFVYDQTNGMIEKMLEGEPDPLTVAILINAVYFKGSWKRKFDPTKTEKGIFKTTSGEEREAMFMKDTRLINVAIGVKELGDAKVISLEYGMKTKNKDSSEGVRNDAEFCALFLLPPKNTKESLTNVFTSLAKLSKNTSKISLKDILDKMNPREVQLSLPRFRVSYGTISLKPQLRRLGINDAFDGHNIFSQLSEDPRVYLDDVLHQSAMEVTEEGTVAAASTSGVINTRFKPIPLKMNFHRPFGMIVLHVPSMTPLFVARMEDPEFIL